MILIKLKRRPQSAILEVLDLSFSETPFVILWELTRACDLACRHCRADAQVRRDARELSTKECFHLLEEMRRFHPSAPLLLVLTGGDPLKRPDLFSIIEYAAALGFRTTVTPSGTDLLQHSDLARMKQAGVARLAVSVDGADASVHDAFRGVSGSFEKSLQILRWAKQCEIETQINTTFTRLNLHHFDGLTDLCSRQAIALWSVFLLVPTGRALPDDMLSADEIEQLFERLTDLSVMAPFDIKTTAAPHYRRVLLQRRRGRRAGSVTGRAPQGVNDGNGILFVSHTGEVYPSGFLPLSAGNVRQQPISDIYRNAPLFRALRAVETYKGKCGVCEYRKVCGGSRARAYGMTADYLESDPSCSYWPRALRSADLAAAVHDEMPDGEILQAHGPEGVQFRR